VSALELVKLTSSVGPVLRKKVLVVEEALEGLGRLFRLVQLEVAAGDVPELGGRASELESLLEVADRIVISAFSEGAYPLLIEGPCARYVVP
jgi:hypothetical protein